MRVYVEGIGLRAPGIPDWPIGRRVLAGQEVYDEARPVVITAELLLAAERRRATETVKLALTVCRDACASAGIQAAETPSVFASSGGDGATITAILETLATAARELSPTRFHNSVHNAPSGYWSIATQSREATTSLCAFDWSFAAGLLEATSQAITTQRAILLAVYDLAYPLALQTARPIVGSFGVALVLSPTPTISSLAEVSIEVIRQGDSLATTLPQRQFEMLRGGNPAARALPLLAAIGQTEVCEVLLEYVSGNLLKLVVAPRSSTSCD